MQRREFITLLGAMAVAAWPRAARAQQGEQMRRIGVLMGMAESDPQGQLNLQALQKGLRERGLNEGQNLRIDLHFGAGTADSLRTAVTEILATPM